MLKLASYEYTISFRPTHKHGNADAFSRLQIKDPEKKEEDLPTELVLLIEAMDQMPITAVNIWKWTQSDQLLTRVDRYTQKGWPMDIPETLKLYSSRRTELSTLNGCLLWKNRVVIPEPGRRQLLNELQAHIGMAKMKSLTRMYLWWPKIDDSIEQMVRLCRKCQEQQREAILVPLQPWKWPSSPWSRIHVDHIGPFLNSTFFIIVDSHTKWVEIFQVPSTFLTITIQCLQTTFTRFGLPQTIVSDNGSSFTSTEFQQFVKTNGINHVVIAPYQPQPNAWYKPLRVQ